MIISICQAKLFHLINFPPEFLIFCLNYKHLITQAPNPQYSLPRYYDMVLYVVKLSILTNIPHELLPNASQHTYNLKYL